MKRISWLAYLLVILSFLGAALLFVWHGSTISANEGAGNGGNSTAQSLPTPPSSCHYCSTRLLNASLDEIGKYAVQYATNMREAIGAQPQVLLTRMVTPQDYPALGLGCPMDFHVIEVPPLALVILKGDFHPNISGMGAEPPGIKYIGYVFDLWADAPTLEMSSRDGGVFRIALNDPTLPNDETDTSICPTPVPSKETLHYGDAAPGFLVPPTLPPDMQGNMKPTPTTPIISGTPMAPAPVQTLEDVHVPPSPLSTQEATARSTTVQMGSPAIQPSIKGAGPSEPAFTEADVRKYTAVNGVQGFGKIEVETGVAQVTDIEFLTNIALQQKMGQDLGIERPAQDLVCLVEYSGKFVVYGPPIAGANGGKPTDNISHFDRSAEVFDAHTGNLLALTAFNSR